MVVLMKFIPTFIMCLLCLILASCSPLGAQYRVIQQGNLIDEEQVAQLEPGMSTKQVEDIMGTPLSTNIFNPDRVSYVYSLEQYREPLVLEQLIIEFENGRVVDIDYVAAEADSE